MCDGVHIVKKDGSIKWLFLAVAGLVLMQGYTAVKLAEARIELHIVKGDIGYLKHGDDIKADQIEALGQETAGLDEAVEVLIHDAEAKGGRP